MAPAPETRLHPLSVAVRALPPPVLRRQERVARAAAEPWAWIERGLALALLVLAAPAVFLLAAFVVLVDGRPAFYRGERLGRNKRPFSMTKIRTLRRGAEALTADRLLEAGDGLEIPGGRLLRDSRLDELPQLWSIVRGDMRFIGPRPERRRVYLQHCRAIPGYARRFRVHPGMIGPSQLFTPHGTHKRIRCWLDNAWFRRQRSTSELLGLTAYTVLVVAGKVGARALEALGESWRSLILRRHPQQRRLRRVRPAGAGATLLEDGGSVVHARLQDLNEEALCVRSSTALRVGTPACVRLFVRLTPGERPKVRSADVSAVVIARRRCARGYELVLQFTPSSPRSHYVLHQYFLRNSLARPRVLRIPRRRAARTPGITETSFPRRAWSAGLGATEPRADVS
jgi:lipopolysaccharide/colanic/teichoic acid biosynthesis glycosyltransferase